MVSYLLSGACGFAAGRLLLLAPTTYPGWLARWFRPSPEAIVRRG
nr:MAG TPA: hypothetical protein [Caudoviricetes sp.]